MENDWIEISYENLPNENCKIYVCVEGIPKIRSKEFSVNGNMKYIKKGQKTGKITHFKIKTCHN